jgi:ribosomal protein S18 acetylase RimI-like enzyme
MAILKLVETEQELIGLKLLQTNNLRRLVGEAEAMKEGFVTSEYSLELLKKMHEIYPSIIVKEGDEVVGYTIVTNKAVFGEHPELDHLFNTLDATKYNNVFLKAYPYILIGQVCVGKSHRGQGWVPKMYDFYKSNHAKNYKYLVTDISQANKRSIRMHEKIGFEIIGVIEQVGTGWDIVLWDWNATK